MFQGIDLSDSTRFMEFKPKLQYDAGLDYTYRRNEFKMRFSTRYFDEEIRSAGLSKNIKIRKTAFSPLVFKDAEFDLVISRGVFFFLDENGDLLREISRVLKDGGMAFIGGGFGKDTPKELIHPIKGKPKATGKT